MKEPSFTVVYKLAVKVIDWFDNHYPAALLHNKQEYVHILDGGNFNKWLRHKYVDPIINECCYSIGLPEYSDYKPIVAQTLSILVARELNR